MASYMDDGMVDGMRKGGDPFFISTYLDSPILCTATEVFRKGIDYWKCLDLWPPSTQNKKVLRAAPLYAKEAYNIGMDLNGQDIPPNLDAENYPSIVHMSPRGYGAVKDLPEALSLAGEIYHDACSGLEDWLKAHAPKELKDKPYKPGFNFSPSKEELYWYSRWSYWDTLTETAAAGFSQKKHFSLRVDMKKAGFCVTNAKVAVLRIMSDSSEGAYLLLSWDQIMMIKDLCFSRAQVYTAARTLYPLDESLVVAVTQTIQWHEECLTRYKNEGFEILKQTESLSKAYLSLCSGDKFGEEGPYGRMVEKVKQKEVKMGLKPGIISMAEKFRSILDQIPNPHLSLRYLGFRRSLVTLWWTQEKEGVLSRRFHVRLLLLVTQIHRGLDGIFVECSCRVMSPKWGGPLLNFPTRQPNFTDCALFSEDILIGIATR